MINYGSIGARIRIKRIRPPKPPTRKELNLLQQVAQGQRYQDIARTWNGTSLQVVKNTAKNVLDKLGADTITHAVAQALRRGLIQ